MWFFLEAAFGKHRPESLIVVFVAIFLLKISEFHFSIFVLVLLWWFNWRGVSFLLNIIGGPPVFILLHYGGDLIRHKFIFAHGELLFGVIECDEGMPDVNNKIMPGI